MTIAFLVNPNLCPVQTMHIRVDEKGFTRPDAGAPIAKSARFQSRRLLPLHLSRLAAP